MEGDGSVPNNRVPNNRVPNNGLSNDGLPDHSLLHNAPERPAWLRRLPLAAAALAALCFLTTPAAAQDVPWGHKSDTKKTDKKKADKKKPAAKAPKASDAKRAPAKASPQKAAPAATDAKAAGKPAAADAKAPTVKKGATGDATGGEAKPKVELVKIDLIEHFKQELAPHGKWLKDPTHGDVWIPNPATVGEEWAPYRDHGHWAVTDQGEWAWVSDMAWGKIPFHYGRWAWSPTTNWMWKPGTEHAPAWVVWRVADDNRKFVGWAPMAPEAPEGAAKTVLPFYFAPTRYLFSPHMNKFVIANPGLAQKMFAGSKVYAGHAADPASAGSGLKAATPSFADVKVPVFAMPKTRLPSTDEAVAPVLGVKGAPTAEAATPAEPETAPDAEGRFATPPPKETDGKQATSAKKQVQPARRARTQRSWQKNRPRYRCWWTNTRPRIWRCGY